MAINHRYETISGEALFEVISPEVIVGYDPLTQDGTVTFNAARYLSVEGVYRDDIPPSRCGSVSVSFQDLMTRRYADPGTIDPVTGTDLSSISGVGVILIIKAAFDRLWNEAQAPPPEVQEGD